MLKWWQLKVGDYVLVKFSTEHYKNKIEVVGIVTHVSGDTIIVREPNNNKMFLYASGIGARYTVSTLSRYKLYTAKESDFLIERV